MRHSAQRPTALLTSPRVLVPVCTTSVAGERRQVHYCTALSIYRGDPGASLRSAQLQPFVDCSPVRPAYCLVRPRGPSPMDLTCSVALDIPASKCVYMSRINIRAHPALHAPPTS